MRLSAAVFVAFLTSKSFAQQYKVTDQVYFDVAIGDGFLGTIVVGLFGDVAPKTTQNFKVLAAEGIRGKNYTGTPFHRVIERFMIQGGDILHGNGSGFTSIYGDLFEDENFVARHSGPGYVSMANAGPDSNGCQFFITTQPTPWLDDHHVVFGKVLQGQAVVHRIEHVKTDSDYRPLVDVVIRKSGVKQTTEAFYVSDLRYGLWTWIQAGFVPLGFSFFVLGFFHWAIRRLDGFKSL